MSKSRQTSELTGSARRCSADGIAGSPITGNSITRARIEQALGFMAAIVAAPGGEIYLPIFERLERELVAVDAKTDALQRARSMVAAIPKSSPSTRRGA